MEKWGVNKDVIYLIKKHIVASVNTTIFYSLKNYKRLL